MRNLAKKRKAEEITVEEPELITIPELEPEAELYTENKTELPKINEEKHNTFLRLAKPRTQKVVRSLKILGNCANKGSYDYTHLEIVKIFDYIQKALDETKEKFSKKLVAEKELFDF